MAEIIAKIIMSIFVMILLPNWFGVIIVIAIVLFGKLENSSNNDDDMFDNHYDDYDDMRRYSNPYYYNASTDLSDIIIYGFED